MTNEYKFNLIKFFLFLAKTSVITVSVILYDIYSHKDSGVVLDKTLSLLNSTVQELYLSRLTNNLRGIDDDPRSWKGLKDKPNNIFCRVSLVYVNLLIVLNYAFTFYGPVLAVDAANWTWLGLCV